jgi:hypothetical protein
MALMGEKGLGDKTLRNVGHSIYTVIIIPAPRVVGGFTRSFRCHLSQWLVNVGLEI